VREILVPAAAAAAFLAAVLVRREVLRLAAATPFPVSDDHDVYGEGFSRALLLPAIPVAVFVALTGWVGARSGFEATVVGQLLVTAIMTFVLPGIAGQLLIWAHRPVRLDRKREGAIIERLRRAGTYANEVWVCDSPIAVFWRGNVLSPAIIVGQRILLWQGTLRIPPSEMGGLALTGPSARFWGWALLPFASALYVRAVDETSIVPWWPFIVVAAIITAAATPTLLAASRLRRNLRTDSGAREIVTGAVKFGLLESWLAAHRGSGVVAASSAAATWIRTARKCLGACRLSGIDPEIVTDTVRAGLDRSRETSPSM
jgi:hypothetical protein